jgi:hypothetical protein
MKNIDEKLCGLEIFVKHFCDTMSDEETSRHDSDFREAKTAAVFVCLHSCFASRFRCTTLIHLSSCRQVVPGPGRRSTAAICA